MHPPPPPHTHTNIHTYTKIFCAHVVIWYISKIVHIVLCAMSLLSWQLHKNPYCSHKQIRPRPPPPPQKKKKKKKKIEWNCSIQTVTQNIAQMIQIAKSDLSIKKIMKIRSCVFSVMLLKNNQANKLGWKHNLRPRGLMQPPQNVSDCFLCHILHILKIWRNSVFHFFCNVANRQTN